MDEKNTRPRQPGDIGTHEYKLPKGMNPADMPNPHYITPDEMREIGMKRIDFV